MSIRPLRLASLATTVLLVVLAACSSDPVAPAAPLAPRAAARLLAAGEDMRILTDSTDAQGNVLMIAEYAAGTYFPSPSDPTAPGASVASVTIRTFIPGVVTSSGYCITSTIERIETTPGWTASVKKPGGCDKEIEVALENRTTRQRATFSFLYVAGKTRIDHGLVR